MLDEALIPEEGRQVRCIACTHVWRQIPHPAHPMPHPAFLGGADVGLQMNVSSEKQSSWIGWFIFAPLLLIGLSVLIFGRNFIVTHWPDGEKYYELVGLQVNLPGSGLSIANASSQIHLDGSVEMIRVMGNVVNTSDSVHSIPPLKIKLMGENSHPKCLEKSKEENSCVLDHWEHRLSEQSLLPGEKLQFETDPRPKVEGSHHIRVEF
jgi:hypothetical protein